MNLWGDFVVESVNTDSLEGVSEQLFRLLNTVMAIITREVGIGITLCKLLA